MVGLYQIQTINTLKYRVLDSHNRIALEVLLFGQLLFVPKSSNFGKGYGIKSGAVGNIKTQKKKKKRNTLRTWGTCGKNTLGTHVSIGNLMQTQLKTWLEHMGNIKISKNSSPLLTSPHLPSPPLPKGKKLGLLIAYYLISLMFLSVFVTHFSVGLH
jgi:hypothetical protein